MADASDFATTEEAAAILGVTVRRVQQMLDNGDLIRVARGLVDRSSLDRYQASARGGRTRVWAEHTAWAAIALLSGVRPTWLGPTQTSRLRATLLGITVSELVTQTRDRASVHVYRAHPAALTRLAQDLVVTDSFALGLVEGMGLGGVPLNGFSAKDADSHVNGYLAADTLAKVEKFYGLRSAATGNLTVRATTFDLAVVGDLATAKTLVLTALDAAAALDPRERGLGLGALDTALDAYRR